MGILSGLISAGLNLFSKKSARRDAINDQINKLPRLRESAEKAGFNPLTALLATGGSGFGMTGVQAPPLASFAAVLGEIADDAVERRRKQEASMRDAREGAAKAVELVRREEAAAGSAGAVVQRTSAIPSRTGITGRAQMSVGPFTPVVAKVRPVARPTPYNRPRVPAYNPFGEQVFLPADVAKRLDIPAFGTIMAGDWAEIGGEIREVEVAAGTERVAKTMGIGSGFAGALAPKQEWYAPWSPASPTPPETKRKKEPDNPVGNNWRMPVMP